MIVNISAYKFIKLENLPRLRVDLMQQCQALAFKGTILLSTEGMNLALAGTEAAVNQFADYLAADERFADIILKRSLSPKQPFRRLRVRVKPEIIRLNKPEIAPAQHTVSHLDAETLKQWLDEGRELTLLDTRNDYEVSVGTFEGAIDLDIETFTEFPDAVKEKLAQHDKNKPVVMFCTGGVRCEKAGPAMEQQGFKKIYQLEGGILKYLETCGDAHWQGECFVFDDRVAVDTKLNPSNKGYCPNCSQPVAEEYCHLPAYERVKRCVSCTEEKQQRLEAKRLDNQNHPRTTI
ncbi:MAG: rhodanese-like domain-containing protein [Pseudomonadota bacterium]